VKRCCGSGARAGACAARPAASGSPLAAQARQLTDLNLSANALTAVEGLAGLSRLTALDLAANRLRELAGLDGLRALRRLSLAHNQLAALPGLAALQARASPRRRLGLAPRPGASASTACVHRTTMAQLARAGRRVRAGQPGPARQPPGPPAGAGGAGRLPAPARTVAPVRARVQRRQRPPRAGPCTQPAVRPARPARRAGRRAAAAARAGRRAAGAGARGAPGRGRAGCLCAGSAPDTAVYRPLRGRPLPQKSVAKQGGSCARKPGSEHPRTASEARQHVQRGACASVRRADFLKPSRHCKQRL